MAWTTPITWAIRDAITMVKLNAQIRDNMNFLFNRTKHVVTILGNGANLTSTSTSFVAVDDAQFTLTVNVIAGETVRLWLNAAAQHSLTTGSAIFDVIIDDATYVSSGTATPATTGCWLQRSIQGASAAAVGGVAEVSGLSAGSHTFKLRWKVITAGTITLFLSGSYFQFGARTT